METPLLQTKLYIPPTAVLTSLINEITAIPDRIVLILDDYHIIESSLVDDALALLLEHLPPQMQLASESGMAQTVVGGWLLATWGEVLAETNDLDGAIHQAKTGVEIAEAGGDLAMLGRSYLS